MKVLFLTTNLLSDKFSGPQYILQSTCVFFKAKNIDFKIVNTRSSIYKREDQFFLKQLNKIDYFRTYLGNAFLSSSEENFINYVKNIANDFNFIVWFGSLYDPLSKGLLVHDEIKSKIVYHLSDSIYLFEITRQKKFNFLRKKFSYYIEKNFLNNFDVKKIYVSKRDYNIGLEMVSESYKKFLFLLPIGVDLNFYSRRKPYIMKYSIPKIMFSGILNYKPNLDSAIFILEKVLPLIKMDFELRIVGKFPPDFLYNYEKLDSRIRIVGEVKDIRSELESASLFLAPMVSGSGIKIKILQALAYGVPIITNRIGVEGFLDIPFSILVCNDEFSIAKKIQELLTDNNELVFLSRKNIEIAHSQWGWNSRTEKFINIIRSN